MRGNVEYLRKFYPDAPWKKFYGGSGGFLKLPSALVGTYVDKGGVEWAVWEPCGNELSAMVRLEAPARKSQQRYDPGNHWRRVIRESPDRRAQDDSGVWPFIVSCAERESQ